MFSSTLSTLTHHLTSLLSRPDYKHTSAHIDVELPHHRRHYDSDITVEVPRHRRHHHETEIDVSEREYRSRVQPSYREETRVGTTVDPPSRFQPTYREETRVETTVDPPRFELPRYNKPSFKEEIRVETKVEAPRYQQDKMGYYDEDGKSISTIKPHHTPKSAQVTTTPSATVSTRRLTVSVTVSSMENLIITNTMRRKKLTFR